MPVPGTISFLTDYGLADGFVGVCHGVIARISPGTRVIDLTHLVAPGDVRQGAALLAQAVAYLPPAVHLAVVDPGVGGPRRPIALRAGGQLLVGPDNGLLLEAAETLGPLDGAWELTEAQLMLPHTAATFHGRDVFAPVAAHLATGVPVERVGPALDPGTLVRLPAAVSRIESATAYGEVTLVDRYGNIQTSLTAAQLAEVGAAPGVTLLVEIDGGGWRAAYGRTFGDVDRGRLVGLVDSAGRFALAINIGNAASYLGLTPGDQLTVRVDQ